MFSGDSWVIVKLRILRSVIIRVSKLAICFITYNREKNIEEDLRHIAQTASRLGVEIYIFDGSLSNKTQAVTERYIVKGYQNIHYRHYGEQNVQKNTVQRVADVFTIPDVDYIWLCGDKFLVSKHNYKFILDYIDQGYDIITMYDRFLNGIRFFDDAAEFVEYSLIPLTHFGSTIIRKDLFEKLDINKIVNEWSSFGIWYLYISAINKEKFKGITVHFNKDCFLVQSRYNVRSHCQNHMWDTWIKDWYNIVMHLPARYKKIQFKIINKINRETHFFGVKELLRQRSEKQFDLKKCIQYKNYIRATVPKPIIKIYLIALIPPRAANAIYSFWIKR